MQTMNSETHSFSIDTAEKQRQLTAACNLLASIVRQYDAMPDGPLGRGLTNGPFLAARDFLATLPATKGEPTT